MIKFLNNLHFLTLLCVFFALPLLASNEVTCSTELQTSLQKILQVPEAKTILNQIRQEGPIKIIAKRTPLSQQFGAYWDPDHRVICLDISSSSTEGLIIGSLLFEMQNASQNTTIHQINQLAAEKKISKQKYVERMEYLEYINSKKASKIAQKGIAMGIFPSDSQLPTYATFTEHFNAQKISGHSDVFNRNYDICINQQKNNITR